MAHLTVGAIGAGYLNNYATIGAAIIAAADGDDIEVWPANYNEDVDFGGKAIEIHAKSGPTATTITAAGNVAVTFDTLEGRSSVLRGFTITNGTLHGVVMDDTTPIVENCIIHTNGNVASGVMGGGVYVTGVGELAEPLIRNCLIYENTANDGGGIGLDHGRAYVYNCTIADNTADDGGVGGVGGGYHLDVNKLLFMTNCIFWGNTDTMALDASDDGYIAIGATAYVTNCVVDPGTHDIQGTMVAVNNIMDDPLFTSPGIPDFDYTLQDTSPSIGTGTVADAYISLNNFKRSANGLWDMGAYEKFSYSHIAGKVANVYQKDGVISNLIVAGNIEIGVATPAKRTFYLGDHDGDEISNCDALDTWIGVALAFPAGGKEGAAYLQDTNAAAAPDTAYETEYSIGAPLDISHRHHLLLWFKNNGNSTDQLSVRFYVEDGVGNQAYWDVPPFVLNTWYHLDFDISRPHGFVTAMPDMTIIEKVGIRIHTLLAPVNYIQDIDWVTHNPLVAVAATGETRVNILVNDVLVPESDYNLSISGAIYFHEVPGVPTNTIKAEYMTYPALLVLGVGFNWELTRGGDALEVTDMGDSGLRTYIPLSPDSWTVTLDTHYLLATIVVSTLMYIKMYLDVQNDPYTHYEGAAYLTEESVTQPVDGIVDRSLSFQGDAFLDFVD